MKANPENAKRYIQDAARQRLIISGCLRDFELANSGWKFRYAADVNVVRLYTDPDTYSVNRKVDGKEYEGFAQVFHDDDRKTCQKLGRALADFLFFVLPTAEVPMLLLPSHNEEMQRVFYAIARNAEQEHIRVGKESVWLEKKLEQVEQSTNEAAKKNLIEKIGLSNIFIDFLYGRSGMPSWELIRLGELVKQSRLKRLEDWIEQESDGDFTQAFQGWQPISSEHAEFSELLEKWNKLILQVKMEGRSALEDASAMARLEIINRRLEKKNKRLLFVTGDRGLIRAAENDFRNGESESFADRYLRYPRAYFADHRLLRDYDSDDVGNNRYCNDMPPGISEFVESLKVFFAESTEKHPWDDPVCLKKWAENGVDSDIDEATVTESLNKLRAKWDGYANWDSVGYGLSKLCGKNDRGEQINTLLDKLQNSTLPELFCQHVRTTWLAFYDAAVESGTGLLEGKVLESDLPRRGVPLLQFHKHDKAQAFANSLVEGNSEGGAQLFHQTIEEDDGNYIFYLISALNFAFRNRWQLCKALCERAMLSIQELPRKDIVGHEAAFLHAIAIRHDSKSANDLEGVEEGLIDAQKRLDEEKGTDARPDVRIESEKLALILTYHLFHAFKGESLPDKVPSLPDCQERLCDFLGNLNASEETPSVRLFVERHALTNLFTTVFLRMSISGEHVDIEKLKGYVDKFKSNVAIKKGHENLVVPFRTMLVDSMLGFAEWLVEKDLPTKRRLRKNILKLLTEPQIENKKVLPYDVERYSELRKFIFSNP